MTDLLIIANDRALDDSLNLSLLYGGPQGLFEPAMVSSGAIIDTFSGPMRVAAQPNHFEPRRMKFSGLIGAPGGSADGHLDLYQRAHDAFRSIQGRPARIQVGSLFLDVAFGQLAFSGITDNPRILGWSLDAEAVPATFGAIYGYAIGAAQGIPVVDDRRDRTELCFGTGENAMADVGGGRVFTVYNPGSAPCDLPLLVSGLAEESTYYLVNRDPRAGGPVVFSTGDGQETFFLSQAYGVKCFPGTNTFQLQTDAKGTLAPGTYKWAVAGYPAPWRFLGNAAGRFGDSSAIWHHARRGTATACMAASGTTMAIKGDMAARIGLPLGGYSAGSEGLILEGQATNLIQYPEAYDNAYWTKNALTVPGTTATAPDGTNTMDMVGETMETTTHHFSRASVFTTGQPACLKVFAKASTRSWIVVGFDITDDDEIAYFDIGGGAVGTVGADVSAKIFDWGGGIYLCCVYTDSAPGTDFVVGLATGDGGKSYYGGGGNGAYVWGMDGKALPFPDSYVPNPAALPGGAVRVADQAAIHIPHNYLRHSHDLSQGVDQTNDAQPASDLTKWIRRGTTAITAARTQTTADGTATGTLLTSDAEGDSLFQRVQPDCRPSATPWTFVVTVRKTGSSPTSVDLKIKTSTTGTGEYEDYSTTVATTTITLADIPDTASSRTYFVTGTPGATAVDLIVEVIGNTDYGGLVVEHAGLFKGTFPALPSLTESGYVPFSEYGWQWLASWTQNGYIQWKSYLPPISAGLTCYLIGESGSKAIALFRDASTSAYSGTKATSNTKTSVTSIAGKPTLGTYTLRVNRSASEHRFYWNGTPASGNPYMGWPTFPISITDASAGTITLANDGGPPGPGGGDYDDDVVVAVGSTLAVHRKADGGPQTSNVEVGDVWDDAVHTFKIEWRNYALGGTQSMHLYLYVDGVAKYSSGNLASSTVTKWSSDERLWLSKGEVYGVIRELEIGAVPASSLPAGAIPAIPGS